MKHLIRFVLSLLIALGPLPLAHAQNGGYTRRILTLYDASSATETFCALSNTENFGSVALAAAASNTVTGTNAFADVAAGDELFITEGTSRYVVGVQARASATSITAAYRDPATLASATLTLTAATFRYRTVSCGTAQNSGAFSVGQGPFSVNVTPFTINATSIAWRIQCRTTDVAGWTQVYPELTPPTTTASFITATTASTGGYTVSIDAPFRDCRVGFKVDTDSGVNALSVSVSGRQF